MKEILESAVDSTKKASALGERAKQRLLTHVKQEPARTFSIILAGSVLVSLLIGFQISRMGEESRRQRLLEDGMREVMNWIRLNGEKDSGSAQGGSRSNEIRC